MLPFVLAGLGVAFGKNYNDTRQNIVTLVAMISISIPIYMSTINSQPHSTMDYVTPWHLRPLVMYDALSFYISKILAPLTLCPDYGRNPEIMFPHRVGYAIWVLPATIIALAVYYRKRVGRIILGSLLCSFIILLPVSGILPFEFQDFSTVADRYFYFPMFGICLAIALLVKKFELKRFKCAIFITLGVLAVRALFGIQPWQNNQAFFQNAIACNPTSAGMYMHSGLYNFKTGNYRIAFEHYHTALRIKPGYQEAHLNYGQALAATGNLDSAITHYKEALRIMPTAEVHNNLGTAYAQQNHLDEAIAQFEKALKTSPVFVEALCNMGYAMFLKGKNEQARYYLKKALQVRPGYQEALIRLRKIESSVE
jgi:lipopolysaccharide biosynthesis regulator YciM